MYHYIGVFEDCLYAIDERQLIVATRFGVEEEFYPFTNDIPREVWLVRWEIDRKRLILLGPQDDK